MIETLSSVFVGKPLNIFFVSFGVLLLSALSLRMESLGAAASKAWLISGLAWLLYGLWETLVKIKTPEANIRVDLMLIWPVLLLLLLWSVYRSFK